MRIQHSLDKQQSFHRNAGVVRRLQDRLVPHNRHLVFRRRAFSPGLVYKQELPLFSVTSIRLSGKNAMAQGSSKSDWLNVEWER